MHTSRNISSTDINSISRLVAAYLQENLSPSRYTHTRSVARCATELCLRFGLDESQGNLAGLGHDLAREWRPEHIRETALEDGEGMCAAEEKEPLLMHGRAAAVVLQRDFGLYDDDVLAAIRTHTLGAPGMSGLQKVLFCADYLEPHRRYVDATLRKRTEGLGLNELVILVVEHNQSRGYELAEPTRQMYDQVRQEVRGR